MSNIKAEELFGIIPKDEDDPPSLTAVIQKKKVEIDALQTRKSKDVYENQREREGDKDFS